MPPPPLLSIPPFSSASTSRLQALYSDFSRQKQSNPASYYANIEWWRSAFESLVWEGFQRTEHDLNGKLLEPRLTLSASQSLVDSLRIERVGKPIAMGTVITELQSSKSSGPPQLFPLAQFIAFPTSIYASSSYSIPGIIASYLIVKPLWWTLEQFGVTGEDGLFGSSQPSSSSKAWHGEYVLTNLVERAAEAVILQRRKATGGAGPDELLYTSASFRKAFAFCIFSGAQTDQLMSERDAKVLLKHLERDQGVLIVDGDVIKFIDKTALPGTQLVTAVDRGILELKTAVDNLHEQIECIQARIDAALHKAADAVKHKRKNVAMSHLRLRKQLEEILTKRLGSLENLEGTLNSVEMAAGDIQILSAFESSTTTLRTILSHPSLQRESVEQTMEAMAEANTDAREIDDMIKIGGDVALGTDLDVDDEFQQLMQEAAEEEKIKEAAKVREQLGAAPSPPEHATAEKQRSKEPSHSDEWILA